MMAKLTKGGDFRGCVNYVTRAKKDNPDGTPCDEWRIIASGDIPEDSGREEIIPSFEDNQALNPRLKNVVGHFSLNFHAEDKAKINDAIMAEIAHKYMERMGIVDTPFIIVRHYDKDYPHCHLVFSRVDNHGETISDKNDFKRNQTVCLDLTKEYGLHISEGKSLTKVNRLRGVEKIRYEIFNAINDAWNDGGISSFEQFEARLKAAGVGIEYKYRSGTNQVQGLWYTRKGKKFPASKIDRHFSYGNIQKHLKENKPLHPNSKWMYADGSIVPLSGAYGVKFSQQQSADYVAGKTIRLDGCNGNYPTLFLRFNRDKMAPTVSTVNPEMHRQPTSSPSFSMGYIQSSPVQDEPGIALGKGLSDDFKHFCEMHPSMSYEEAIHKFKEEQKAKARRRQGPKLH